MEEDRSLDSAHAQVGVLLGRIRTDNPDPEDIKALRTLFQEHHNLWRTGADLAVLNQKGLLEIIPVPHRELFHAALNGLRQELGHKGAPMLEQMLIEQVLLAWLRLYLYELNLTITNTSGSTPPQADFWERKVSAAQRRYLRACETLARVRRLARTKPMLQVNINTDAGQQVNIAGDFIKEAEVKKGDVTNEH